MTDLCLKNEAYTVCSAPVPSRGLCQNFTYRTRHTQCVERLFVGVLMTDFCFKNEAYTQCVARLFLRVAYVGSLLIERGIHSV